MLPQKELLDMNDITPLMRAARAGSVEDMKQLMEKGVSNILCLLETEASCRLTL